MPMCYGWIIRQPITAEDYICLGIVLLFLLWLLYDLLVLHWAMRAKIRGYVQQIQGIAQENLSKHLGILLANLDIEKLPEELKKLAYFKGLRREIVRCLKTPEFQKKYVALKGLQYAQMLGQLIFQNVYPPRCREDLELCDYKWKHREREISINMVQISKIVEANLPQEVAPLIQEIIAAHHQEVQAVRKAIQKDQDALPVLGMEIPLASAADVIAHSGEDFDVAGIHPKSLCSIAEAAQARDWDLFCRLVVKAASGNVSSFLTAFSFDPVKGETTPIGFLSFFMDWIVKNKPLDLQNTHLAQIRDRLLYLEHGRESQRISTAQAQEQDEEAKSMLIELRKKYMSSKEAAMRYLQAGMSDIDGGDLVLQVSSKRRLLQQELRQAAKDKRKKLLVEIHFLTHEVQPFLLQEGKAYG